MPAFAQPIGDCTDEAKIQYMSIIDAVALGDNPNEIDSSIQNLQTLARSSCISKEKLPSHFDQYFNIQSAKPGAITEEYRKNWWDQQISLIKYISKFGTPEQLARAKENLQANFKRVRPEDILIPSLDSIVSASPVQKSKTCQNQKSITPKLPPIRDQGDAGWCYLYASSDLLSFMTQKNISAAYLGHILSPRGSTGNSTMALNHVTQNFGLCLESTMPSNPPTEEYIKQLEDFDKNAEDFLNSKPCENKFGFLQTYFQKNIGDIAQLVRRTVLNGKVIDLKIPTAVIAGETQYSENSIVGHLALDNCKKDREALKALSSSIELESLDEKSPDLYMQKINDELDKGRPINFAYKYHNMTNGSGGGDHWSTVVGRRLINGECQLLVRNSWGPTSCTKMVTQADACQPPGHYWVSAQDLYSNVTKVQYAK